MASAPTTGRVRDRLDPFAALEFAAELDVVLQEEVPSVAWGDRIFLILQALERKAEERALPPGSLRTGHFTRSLALAAAVLVEVLYLPTPPHLRPPRFFAEVLKLLRAYGLWTGRVLRLLERERAGATLGRREEEIVRAWLFVRDTFGPPRRGFVYDARKARISVGEPLQEDDDLLQDLSFYKVLQQQSPGKTGAFLGSNGEVRLDWRHLRDVIQKTEGLPRTRSRERAGDDAVEAINAVGAGHEGNVARIQELGDTEVASNEADAAEAAAAIEEAKLSAKQHARLLEWVELRTRTCRVATHRLVLEHFLRLHNGEEDATTQDLLKALARESGYPYRTLQTAYSAERRACREHVRSGT